MEQHSIRSLKRTLVELGGGNSKAEVGAELERVSRKTTRSGSPYLELRFVDSEDSLVLRVWENDARFVSYEQLPKNHFYWLRGDWYYQAEFSSIDARSWEPHEMDPEETEVFLRGNKALQEKQNEDLAFIKESLAEIKDPRLKKIAHLFLEQYEERLLRTAAARNYHHARRGGLIEHTAQMMRMALMVARVYPELNVDLLVTGVLFHDAGKLWENCYPPKGFEMPYHYYGEMLGHIPLGLELVNKLWREIIEAEEAENWHALIPSNEDVRLHLLHLIAAHHGTKEFGSPVFPKTPEAIALHHIDNLDAKMEMFSNAYETGASLSPQVIERVRPMPDNIMRPLTPVEDLSVNDKEKEEEEKDSK